MKLDSAEVKKLARSLGFDHVGICSANPPETFHAYAEWVASGNHGTMAYLEKHLDLKSDPKKLLTSVNSIIAVGLNYYRPIASTEGHPRIARYALGRDYHKVLRGKLNRLVKLVGSLSADAEFRACVDSAPILEREYAMRAGLGWFGKNTCLIDSRTGSWFVIGLLLTSLELEPDLPAGGGCGTCRLCIEACPTGAIVEAGERWQVDSRRCISYLTIEHKGEIPASLHSSMGDWTFGCDVCQEVCPFNQQRPTQPQRAPETTELDFRQDRAWPNLKELAVINMERFDSLTRGSAVRRAGLEGLRRNAQINLANQNRRPTSR